MKRKHKNIVFNGNLRKKKRKREKKSEIPKSRVNFEPKFNNFSISTISKKEVLAKNKRNYEKSGQSNSGERKNE